MNRLDAIDAKSLRSDVPSFRPGDELKVYVKVVEGNKSRVQLFQGVVISRSGAGVRESFTIRKISYGVGVERTFPVHTPIIEKIEVVRKGESRRAKLYFLRNLTGKATKIKERRGADGELTVEAQYVAAVAETPKIEVKAEPEIAEETSGDVKVVTAKTDNAESKA